MMSNQLVFNKYFRFYLHNKDLTTTSNTSDFSVHIAFNGTAKGKNGNDYFINLIKNNGGSIPIKITYNIEEIISYFELVYYMITKCNLTFNSNFTYTNKYVKSAVKKGFFALYAIQKLKNYQIQNNTHHYSESLELKKEKADEKEKGLVIQLMNNKDLAAKSIKDVKLNIEKMTVLDLIHYSTIKEVVNILEYDYDYVNKAINFSIPELMKKFTKEIHFERMPNYVAMLNKTKKISQVDPKIQIIKTPDEIAKIKIIPKNILFKGVPGTGKSRAIDNIIHNVLLIKDFNKVLKINVHDSTSNSDLMQGIGISTNQNSNISYREKSGLILSFIEKAILDPQNEYALVLEEVQENSLNKIIGDLIYLIEKDKRTIIELEDINQFSSSDPYILVNSLIIKRKKEQKPIYFVALPNLIENKKNKNLVFPSNLYVFCTTNYRDDKKIIEDNLLRRFDVIELYPNGKFITNLAIKEIFTQLNDCILEIMSTQESHPDRFMIGQAIWMEDNNDILKPMLKTFIEFKDVRNIDFSNTKDIINLLITKINDSNIYKDNIIEMSTKKNYKELLDYLQKEVYKGII